MAEDGLNDYERLRQDNIRRNEAKLAPLRRKADELSAAIRLAKPKRAYQVRPKAPSGPVRSSGRSRGIAPDNLPPDLNSTRLSPSLASSILGGAPPPPPEEAKIRRATDGFDAGRDMVLKPAHVRKVVPWSITSLRVLPLVDRTVVAAGDRLGNIAFWDVDGASEGDGVFRYWPHKGHVSAIVAQQAAPHKIYSSSRQGEICLMDFAEENFSMAHLWEWPVYSLCQAQNSVRCLYFGDGNGGLTLFDERVGKVLSTWDAHDDRINSIDFHPEKTHILATSSSDRTACIWDVRNMKRKDPDSLKVFKLHKPAQSAYFSPSGRLLAVTRVIWGWNDTDLYVGNMSKGIDIISVDVNDSGLSALKLNNTCLRSEPITPVPYQFSAHPYKVGYLACSNSNCSKVFLWTRA